MSRDDGATSLIVDEGLSPARFFQVAFSVGVAWRSADADRGSVDGGDDSLLLLLLLLLLPLLLLPLNGAVPVMACARRRRSASCPGGNTRSHHRSVSALFSPAAPAPNDDIDDADGRTLDVAIEAGRACLELLEGCGSCRLPLPALRLPLLLPPPMLGN